MAKAKKLFIWRGVPCDYTCGVVCAMASTPDEARKLVLKNAPDWARKPLAAAMLDEPEVHNEPFGFYIYGGG